MCFIFHNLATLNSCILSCSGFSRWNFFFWSIFQCIGFKLCSRIIFVKRDFGHTLENINIVFYSVSQMCCVTELILQPEHNCNYWKKRRAGLSELWIWRAQRSRGAWLVRYTQMLFIKVLVNSNRLALPLNKTDAALQLIVQWKRNQKP